MGQDQDTVRPELAEFPIRTQRAVDRFIGNPDASPRFVEMTFATDNSVGDYPQGALDSSRVYLENDGGLYHDRFPNSLCEPILLKLRSKAKWTDILSSDLWSEGYLLSERALAVMGQFDQGNVKDYKAEVSRRKEKRPYIYRFVCNHISPSDIDFPRSEFYIADMIGSPLQLIEVESAADFDRKREQISEGGWKGVRRFSRLQFKSLRLKPKRIPQAAIFGLGTYGTTVYVQRELCDALRRAGITGLEFQRNNMIFID